MKAISLFCASIRHRYAFLMVVAVTLASGPVRAGLTVDLHLYHNNYGYYFYPFLSANSTLPDFPTGIYQVASPQIPVNGSRLVYQATGGGISECYNGDCGGGSYYSTFDSMLYGITNGLWTITVTNSTATNVYFFSVTGSGLTTDVFGAAPSAVYPTSGATNVPADALIRWTGPADWEGTLYVEDRSVDTNGNSILIGSANLPPGATSWTPPSLLPLGTNTFDVDYQSNATAMVVANQPTNSAGQPISGWVSTATFEAQFVYGGQYNVSFTVIPPSSDYYPFLVARYNFEDTNDPYADSSGNHYYNDCTGSGTTGDIFSTNAAVGAYARLFFGDTSFCFTPYASGYLAFSNALAGNFTVTAWVKTTNTTGNDYDNAYFGAPIFFAGADYNNHCTIPLSITGGKAAFTVVDSSDTVTLHSQTSVNDGIYHFLAVTRQQSSGLMSVYVDGNLEATGTGITDPVNTQGYISIAGGYRAYAGLLDDVRLYSTNLSAADVADLGTGSQALTLAEAIGAPNLAVTTGGDANWFVETTNTYNGLPAADQSGVVGNNQVSTLSATVTGPGTLTFYWSSLDNDPNQDMDYEFSVDDPNSGDIADLYGGGNDWQSITDSTGGPVQIPSGQHTLYWTVFANSDADPFQAGFLDQVVFTPADTNPVSANITFNIFREQDPTFGDIYVGFPSFNSVTPPGTGNTTNRIESPNNFFSARADQGGGGAGSDILYSLASVINEATNGLWNLYINYGLPNQRRFQFNVAMSGLTTNLLPPVLMVVPTNQTLNFPAAGTIQWQGPADYSTLNASKQNLDGSGYVGATLPISATTWVPGLIGGTNRCDITYASNNFPTVSFSVPVDTADSQTVSVWSGQVNLSTTATTIFVVSNGAAPVTLISPQAGNGNFQFSFQSQSGFTNAVQYRTNLILGNWQTYSNVTGDGAFKTLAIPFSLFSPSPQGYVRVGTQ